jgi:hypothetical protein
MGVHASKTAGEPVCDSPILIGVEANVVRYRGGGPMTQQVNEPAVPLYDGGTEDVQ